MNITKDIWMTFHFVELVLLVFFFFFFNSYQKAVDAKKERASKASLNFGAKGVRGGHPYQVTVLSIILGGELTIK